MTGGEKEGQCRNEAEGLVAGMPMLSVSVHTCCCVHVRIVRAYLSVYLYSISQYCKCVSVYMWTCAQHSNTRLSFELYF